MAIRPTIRLINANWHDQTETGGRFLFCSLREPSREEEETKRAIPEGSGRFPAIRRVNMENRPGFWRKEEEKCERERDVYVYIYIYTYLLFSELGLENIGGVADGPHFLQPSFHSRQPDLHLVPFRLVSLAVPEHRIQLRLPLHHFRVHLVPVLPQLRNWNNNRADVPFSNVLLYHYNASIIRFPTKNDFFFFFLCVPLRVWKEIWRNVTRVPVEEKVNVLISREGDNNKCVLLVYCDNPTLKTVYSTYEGGNGRVLKIISIKSYVRYY